MKNIGSLLEVTETEMIRLSIMSTRSETILKRASAESYHDECSHII